MWPQLNSACLIAAKHSSPFQSDLSLFRGSLFRIFQIFEITPSLGSIFRRTHTRFSFPNSRLRVDFVCLFLCFFTSSRLPNKFCFWRHQKLCVSSGSIKVCVQICFLMCQPARQLNLATGFLYEVQGGHALRRGVFSHHGPSLIDCLI